jgi:hypothetical protein
VEAAGVLEFAVIYTPKAAGDARRASAATTPNGALRLCAVRVIFSSLDARGAGATGVRSLSQEVFPMLTVLIIVLIILAIGSAPSWPYSRGWGYYPSGLLGVILLLLIILALTGRL